MRGQMKPSLMPSACPFCGETPDIAPKNPKYEGNAWGQVRCINASCATYDDSQGHGVAVSDGEECGDDRGPGAYMDAAIRRWNARK